MVENVAIGAATCIQVSESYKTVVALLELYIISFIIIKDFNVILI